MWSRTRAAGLVRRLRCVRDRRVMAEANAGVSAEVSMLGMAEIRPLGIRAAGIRMPVGLVVAVVIVVVAVMLVVRVVVLRAAVVVAGQLRVVVRAVTLESR
jgi:hypothetical protein